MRSRIRLSIATALGLAGAAHAQHSQSFDGATGSATGVELNGQLGFYLPSAGGVSGLVYTYAGNALGIPAHPTGGGANFVGSTGPADAVFSRSQLDIDLSGTEAWTISVDVAITFTGTLPTAQNIGSFSTRDLTGGGDNTGVIMLAAWTDPATAATWDASMVWTDAAGTSITETVPDAAFQTLALNHWYRWSIRVDSYSNQITEVKLVDLTTSATAVYNPPDRYMPGGSTSGCGGDATGHVPMGYRLFAGSSTVAGNTVCFDNVSFTEIPAIGACCLLDGTCLPDTPSGDCLANPEFSAYGGTGSSCDQATCYEHSDDGWILDVPSAPLSFCGDTTQFPLACGGDVQDDQLIITVPTSGDWTFSLCDTPFKDSILMIGSGPCLDDIATGDDECGLHAEATATLAAGQTVYVTVTGFDFSDEGSYAIALTSPCAVSYDPVGDPESEACGDDTNGGCNLATPAFEPIALGQTIAGTEWYDGSLRDTDWYEYTNADGNLRWAFVGRPFGGDVLLCDSGFTDYDVTIEQPVPGGDTTMTVTSEAVTVFGMIADADGAPSTDCALVSGILPNFTTDPCNGTSMIAGVIEAGAACTPTNGDTNDDGVVDVTDLLNVLADWGCSGAPGSCLGDVNCDGVTNVTDLLDVLANWS